MEELYKQIEERIKLLQKESNDINIGKVYELTLVNMRLKQLMLGGVVVRSEQLCDFLEWYDESLTYEEREMNVKTYLDMKSHN